MGSRFRFGVSAVWSGDRAEFVEECRKAERLGFDVIAVADHLGFPAPFPALLAAAEATECVRVGTLVLNAGFYNPALLAREVATVDLFTDGRLELGLGAGYVAAEFEVAGIPFGTAGSRFRHLERTVAVLRRYFDEPGRTAVVAGQPRPRLLVAGGGDRLLTLAAQQADVVSFSGATRTGANGRLPAGSAELAERVAFARVAAGDRLPDLEFNLLVQQVAADVDPLLERLRRRMPDLTREIVADAPVFLLGTARDIADQLLDLNERFGITYFSTFGHSMDLFADAMELVQ